MGNVAKQSFLASISAYLGVAIGYVNIVILQPQFMTLEEIGLARTIMEISMFLVPFAFFGSGAAIVKFYPKFQEQIPKLLGLLIATMSLAFLVVLSASYIFQSSLFGFFEEKAARVNDYFPLVFTLLFFMVVFNFFEAISKSNYKIVAANFLRDFAYKASHALIIILYGTDVLTLDQYLKGHIVIYVIITLILGTKVIRDFKISFDFTGLFDKLFAKEIFQFTTFSFMGSFGIIMVLSIDKIMISGLGGLEVNSIYTTAAYMALVIDLPRRYVSQIIHPYISNDLHTGNFSKINKNYRDTSNILIWLGGLAFLGITLNLQNIYSIMPNGDDFRTGYIIVFIIGLTKMIDMAFSINGEIIAISKYYRLNVILILILGIVTVITNSIFIPKYGMIGAASATLLTYVIFNIIKYLLLKTTFRLDPFSWKTLQIIGFLIGFYFLINMIPTLGQPWIDLVLRSIIILVGFGISLLVLKPSQELHELITLLLKRLKRKNEED